METIIKVSPSELDIKLLDKIRLFIGNKQNIDVTISLKEMPAGRTGGDEAYLESLNQSIKQAEDGRNLVSFTMKDFIAYTPKRGA